MTLEYKFLNPRYYFALTIEKTLFEKTGEREESEYNQIYTYWCMVSLEKKLDLLKKYEHVFQNVKVPIAVLEKKDDNGFLKVEHDFKEVVYNLQKTATIDNLEFYIEHKSFTERVNDELIISILNKEKLPFSMVIIDKDFTEVFSRSACGKLRIVQDGNNKLYLSSRSKQERELPELQNEETKNYLLKSLLRKNNSTIQYSFNTGSVRRYIIGIKEFAPLCTNLVPVGIGGDWYPSIGYIISPITISQWECIKHLEVSDFVNSVCSSEEFLNLVNHIYLHQVEKEKYSKEEIIKSYKKFIEEMYVANKK